MSLILNLGLAWLSVILSVLLAIIYALRKQARAYPRWQHAFERVNRLLRRHHRLLGLVLVVTGLVHGLFSSEKVLSLNLGSIAWVLSILLGLNWLFRQQLKGRKGWMHLHRSLTVAFCVILLMHIANVGVQAPRILLDSLRPSTVTARLATDGQAAQGTRSAMATIQGASQSTSAVPSPSAGQPAIPSPAGSQSSGTTQPSAGTQSSIGGSDLATVQRTFAGVTLRDGTYTGTATGYGAGLTVQVVVKGGAVGSVQVVSHHEVNSRFYARPIQLLPQTIVSAQSLDVDLVAGATFTSVGIVNAVRDALSRAVISGTLPSALSLPSRGRR